MNKSVLVLFSLLAISTIAGGCAKVLYAPMFSNGTVSHVVICYLKNKGSEADRKRIIDATAELRKIPGVYDIEVGTVLPSDRPIVVSDYDVGLVVTFRDVAAMKAYVNDPRHQKAVKEVLEPLTSKIVVYDFVNYAD
jgi:hypothetical protein